MDWIPKQHQDFLTRCRPYHETRSHLFLHAGYVPELPLREQPGEALRWRVTSAETAKPHISGKVAVVGHTPQMSGEVLDLGFLLCIDTNCARGGWLTALDIDTGHLWQADRTGRLRPERETVQARKNRQVLTSLKEDKRMAASKKKQSADPGVETYLNGVSDPVRRQDCLALLDIMKEVTGCEAKMWGTSIVGLGDLHYRYASGREGDTFLLGFSSRKPDLTIYLGPALCTLEESLKQLGQSKHGKGCLYIRRLADIDMDKLRRLLGDAAAHNATASVPRKADA